MSFWKQERWTKIPLKKIDRERRELSSYQEAQFTLELSNALRCYVTWLSVRLQHLHCTSLSFEFKTLELSNTLLCHVTWFSFLIQPAVMALLVNPLPEFRVGSTRRSRLTIMKSSNLKQGEVNRNWWCRHKFDNPCCAKNGMCLKKILRAPSGRASK